MLKRVPRKIKFFFDVLVKSLTKFEYYKEIAKAKLSFSLKYLFFLYYLVALIGSVVFAISVSAFILPKAPGVIESFRSQAYSYYPTGLVINIDKGIVTSNQKEPYFINSFAGINLGQSYDHLLTIDTTASPSDIKTYKTMLLLTKDSFVTVDSNNTYKIYPIDTSTDLTIDQKGYGELISQILPYLKYIVPAIIVTVVLAILIWPFIMAGFSFGWQLLYLLIFSAIFFIFVKLLKKNLGFKKLYQLTLHASTLPILLGVVVSTIGLQMPFLLGSIILFVFMILVVNQFKD